MVYRIRYRRENDHGQAEVVVEANSPTEALVKFRHTYSGNVDMERLRQRITSICADVCDAQPEW